MSTQQQINAAAKEKFQEVFGQASAYQPDVKAGDFDKAEYVNKLKEQVESEEASLKARQVLRDQIAKEAKGNITVFFGDEDNYQVENSELDFDKEEYSAKIKEQVDQAINK